MAPFDGSAWEEEEEDFAPPPEVPYYNNFPGKQPPPGGLVDMRTRPGHSTGVTLVRLSVLFSVCVCFHVHVVDYESDCNSINSHTQATNSVWKKTQPCTAHISTLNHESKKKPLKQTPF